MLHFPPKTLFDRRVPKKKFYQNLSVSHSVERKFVEDIESITWKYKLAPDTLNLEAGTQVTEIQVFEIFLKGSQIAQSVLTVIDRGVPYHIIFLLRFNEMAQLRVSYKKENQNRENTFKVEQYYATDWVPYEQLKLEIVGLTMDSVYEHLLQQISQGRLQPEEEQSMEEAVQRDKQRIALEATIQKLEQRVRSEKQFNVQAELWKRLRLVKKQYLEEFGEGG